MKSRIKFMKIFIILIIMLISITPNTLVVATTETPAGENSSLSGTRVAIYNGVGVSGSGDSYIALKYMFEWMGASVDYISAEQVQNGELITYKIFVMPGGDTGSFSYAMGDNGKANIRTFVEMGGVYFGICGGSLFATEDYLNLYAGDLIYPVPGLMTRTTKIINMTVNRNSNGPDLSDEPELYNTLFWGSMYFDNYGSEVIPIMMYPQNGKPGMIAFQKGLGTVFISSPHPEFEEESDRDGTSYFDSFVDPDSEWSLLLKVSVWLVDTANVKISVLWISVGAIATLAAIGIIIFIKRRK